MFLSINCSDLMLDKYNPTVFCGIFRDCFSEIAQIGFKSVEINSVDLMMKRAEIYDALKRNSLTVSSFATGLLVSRYGLSLSSSDNLKRLRCVREIKKVIDIASECNAVVIIGLIKGFIKDCVSMNEYVHNLDNSLDLLLEHAESKNVIIVFEVINDKESDFCTSVLQAKQYIKKFSSCHIGLHLDSYHLDKTERDVSRAIEDAGELLLHFHLADDDRWYPGHGSIDFRVIGESLKKVDYKGALAIESYGLPSSHIAAEYAYRELNRKIMALFDI